MEKSPRPPRRQRRNEMKKPLPPAKGNTMKTGGIECREPEWTDE